MAEGKVRAHAKFYGNVQGVFFRANTRKMAKEFGVNGWVKNLEDGSVEAVFEGKEGDVKGLVDWCEKEQPHATVEDVDVDYTTDLEGFDSFEVRY